MIKTTVIAVATALAFVGGPANAQETLKLGVVAALSGPGAAWGQSLLYAAELAADDVNDKGGLDVAGTKYKVEVIPYDGKYQPNESITATNRLVFGDKVKYIIGPVGSASTVAMQPITEKNKVIIMTLGFTNKALSADKPYSYRPPMPTSLTAQPQLNWIVKKHDVKKVGALFPNDDTGQQIAIDVAAAYDKAGAQLVAKEFFERSRVDMVPLLTRLMAKGIDAIELDGNAPDTAGLIVKQARDLGFKGLIIRTGGPSTPEIVNVAGVSATNGMLVYSPVDFNAPAIKAYSDRYKAKYKKPMNGFSPAFYDGTHMLLQAMVNAGTVSDSEKVNQALEAITDFPGIEGPLSWTGKDVYGINRQLNAPFYVDEVQDGKESVVARCSLDGCQ